MSPVPLPTLQATTFINKMAVGRTRPLFFSCRDANKDRHEYVIKVRSKLGKYILSEYSAGIVGRYLELPIPPIAAIEIHPALIEAIPDVTAQEVLAEDPGPHFGSLFAGAGYNVPMRGQPIQPAQIQAAVEIFAWDMLIQNMDRTYEPTQGNPNCVTNGNEWIIFDHELAFPFLGAFGEVPGRWGLRSQPWVKNHIFYQPIKRYVMRHELPVGRFIKRLNALTDDILTGLQACRPITWGTAEDLELIIQHLTVARDEPQAFHRELLEVLA